MSQTPCRILIVEDDPSLNHMLCVQLTRMGHLPEGVTSLKAMRGAIDRGAPDVMFVDMNLPDGSGFDVLEEVEGLCPVVILTAFGSIDQAVRAMHAGAAEYLEKPINSDKVALALARVLNAAEMERDLRYHRAQALKTSGHTVIGDSPETAEMRRLIALYAPADSPVLIRGEGGTGKEMVARALHDTGPRAEARFVPVECEAPDEMQVEAELFGHERGAVPGGDTRREGILELAQGGTIYLNDVADLTPRLQSKLLRVMESGQFRRIGGAQTIQTQVRILAGTRHDLGALQQAGRFRSELLYRLGAFCIKVPPLRKRPGDIAVMARHFIAGRNFMRGSEKTLRVDTLHALMEYDWPGNVRELRNVIERALIMSDADPEIRPEHLALPGADPGRATGDIVLSYDAPPQMEQIRDDYITLLLERFEGNRQLVAQTMGISERTLYRLIGRK